MQSSKIVGKTINFYEKLRERKKWGDIPRCFLSFPYFSRKKKSSYPPPKELDSKENSKIISHFPKSLCLIFQLLIELVYPIIFQLCNQHNRKVHSWLGENIAPKPKGPKVFINRWKWIYMINKILPGKMTCPK